MMIYLPPGNCISYNPIEEIYNCVAKGKDPETMIVKQKTVKKSLRKATSPRDSVLKVFNKCAKAIKTNLVLKATKKLQEIGDVGDDAQKQKKKELLLSRLKQMKAIDHQKFGVRLAKAKFASHFEEDGVDSDGHDDVEISIEILNMALKHKKVEESVALVEKTLAKAASFQRRERKQPGEQQSSQSNVRKKSRDGRNSDTSDNPILQEALRLRKSKLSHTGKIAKKKAVFMDSLNGESESGGQEEMDEADRVRLEKSIRNRMNRTKNRAIREQEQKENMAIYGPEAEKRTDEIQVEYGRKIRRPQKELRSRYAPTTTNDRGQPKDRSRKPFVHIAPPKLIVATKPIIENAKQDELTFMAKSGKEWKETGVHPSWAAKKINQAPTIVPSQGKKIVFDD